MLMFIQVIFFFQYFCLFVCNILRNLISNAHSASNVLDSKKNNNNNIRIYQLIENLKENKPVGSFVFETADSPTKTILKLIIR